MKKIIIFLIVSILFIVGVVLIEFKPIQKVQIGIDFSRKDNVLKLFSHEDVIKPCNIRFDNEHNFIQTTIEDSTVSENPDRYISEYTFKAKTSDNTDKLDIKVLSRYFTNSDSLVFVRCFTENELKKPFNTTLEIPISSLSKIICWNLNYGNATKPTEMEASISKMDKFEIDPNSPFQLLPASLNYIEFIDGDNVVTSLLMGPINVFKDKEVRLRELRNQKFQPILTMNKDSVMITYSFNLSTYEYEENWFMLSHNKLLDYNDPTTLTNMLSADFCMRKKLSTDGIYHIASSKYYVGASDISYDYYYNYAMWEGRRYMDLYLKDKSYRFFYDMAINSAYTTIKAVSKYGVWVSDIRSKYLWDTYKIPEGYIDTRYCTDAGFFLLKANEEFQIIDAIKAGEEFGDFLIKKYKNKEVIFTKNGGVFFYDYYHPATQIVTHSSLNHILSEMNYLYELYLATNNEDYLNMADLIKKGIDDTKDLWIRKDGSYRFMYDLWYAVYKTNKGLEFKENDYTKTLTYEDLKKAMVNLKNIYGREDPVIKLLIDSKKKFLVREGIQVTN
jgi:hypothetical protein